MDGWAWVRTTVSAVRASQRLFIYGGALVRTSNYKIGWVLRVGFLLKLSEAPNVDIDNIPLIVHTLLLLCVSQCSLDTRVLSGKSSMEDSPQM